VKVSVLVPWSPAERERQEVWAWNEARLRLCLPTDAEILTAAPDRVGDAQTFDRAEALNRARAAATGDVLLVCDADTTYPRGAFREALALASGGGWTLPERYVRLDRECSAEWLARGPDAPPPADWDGHVEQEYPFANSGVVALPAEAWDRVGGFDERIRGWGGEDDCMRRALDTLWGEATRVGVALHLWHPRHAVYNPANFVLADRYAAAVGDPEAMRGLLRERRLG